MNEKRQSADANTEITEILELSDNDFKAVLIESFNVWYSEGMAKMME